MEKKQRVVVITGGSSGLGEELTKQLIINGDIVYVLSRTISNFGEFIECDVADVLQVEKAFNKIKQKHNIIDVLIANAGVGISGALELTNIQEAKNVFDVNVWGAFACIQQAIKSMQKGGKVIVVSSACALFALPYRGLYCASKASINMLTLSFAMELKDSQIAFCAVCPGEIKTPFTKNRIKNFATNERYGNRIKLSADHIDLKQHKRMNVETVANKIVKISYKSNPKPMVVIGAKYNILQLLQRIVPTRMFLWFTNLFFNKK